MPLYAELSATEVVVAPGGDEGLRLTVTNTGTATESYAIVAVGLCAAWTLVDPPSVTLFPGERQTVTVALRPPRTAGVTAGSATLSLRVVPHSVPDEASTVEAGVRVLTFDERRVSVLQPVMRARRSAVYDVVIENLGNANASCRLALEDATRRVTGRFDPPSVGVEPGLQVAVQLRVVARRSRFRRGNVALPFEVHAVQEGRPPAVGAATLLQAPLINRRLLGRAITALGLGALAVVAWFALARPAIDDAADRAVRDRSTATTTAEPTTSSSPSTNAGSNGGSAPPTTRPATPTSTPGATSTPTGSTAPVPTASSGAGAGFSTRLAVTAPLGQPGVATYQVPAATTLRLTDLTLQNPAGDSGRATLSRDGEVLREWGLDGVPGQVADAYVTPIEFQAGQVVTFAVSCAAAGDPNSGNCTPSLLIVGRSAP